MKYKALFTDLDGVIRIWQNQNASDTHPQSGLPDGTIRKAAFTPELLLPAIQGQCTHEAWMEKLVVHLQKAHPEADAARAVQRFSEPVGEVEQAVLNILRACRKSVPLYLVTNATSRLPSDLAALGIADEFDHIFNSSEIGHAKPSAEIFQAILIQADVQAEEAFFIDDSKKNVEAAAALGFRAHHFESVAKLSAELMKLGLLGLVY